ncbi:cytochrome P450 [Desarmillaria tabescens]|uniref:Cytochrome P450 n=1 Tax=Armillaria tabescens TaxID=1929756 RepID=A0AA39N3E9_ARMTA|nr:cytochrome P450 [Desarmillaria tabescens]KAK0455795.1 cytochrome P450 [Desarmillaria tabescens]
MLSVEATLSVSLALLFVFFVRYIQHRKDPARKIQCAVRGLVISTFLWNILTLFQPRSDAHWLWGHEYTEWQNEIGKMYSKWAMALGPVYRIKAAFFKRDIIVATDNFAVHHIHANTYRYPKAPEFLPIVESQLGKGIVYVSGDEHRRQRRLLAPAFTLGAVKGMSDDVVEWTQRFIQRVGTYVGSRGGETTINITPFLSACTLDIIGRVAFGHDFRSGESQEAKDIAESWHKDVLFGRTMPGFLLPIMMSTFPWISKFPAFKTDGVAKQAALKLAREFLRQNHAHLENGDGKDILSILIRDQKHSKHAGDRLSQKALLENVCSTLPAMVGHETTSCTVSFTLFHLARDPEVQKRLRQEIHDLSDFSYDHIQSLPYLDVVCREGLRLHPAGPRTDRIALEDDVLPLSQPLTTTDGNVVSSIAIKAGQVFQIPSVVQNTDPNVWGEDAAEFKPERWLRPDGVPSTAQLPSGPYGNVASFLDGPRSCIGWRLALLEFKIIICLMIRHFELTSTPHHVQSFFIGNLQSFVEGDAQMPIHVKLLAVRPKCLLSLTCAH